jgi:transposase InsO family protein
VTRTALTPEATSGIGATFDTLNHLANELFDYLVYYNNHRPHQALCEQTPKAFAATKTKPSQAAIQSPG